VSSDETWFRWALDERDCPWVIHSCSSGVDAWRLPPPWHMADGRPMPSLDCRRCGCHVFVAADDRVPMSEIDAVLEARRER
jgi:hypothetical protein